MKKSLWIGAAALTLAATLMLFAQTASQMPELDKNGKPVLPRPMPHLVYSPADLAHSGVALPASIGGATPSTAIIRLGNATKMTVFANCSQNFDLVMNVYTADDQGQPSPNFTLYNSYTIATAMAAGSPGKPLYALEVIDGATIARKIDGMGRTPAPPSVAYQQILKGLPAVDFTSDQLIYRPRNVRAHKFFGFSPVEQIILTINIGLRRQIHLLNYYTEGNVPEALAQVPKEWSADQISEFQEWFDSALAGNSARRRRITFVPECGNLQFTRDPALKDALDEWITRIVCYAFGLSPQQFVSVMNRATAETSVEQAAAEGLVPILGYLADTINFIVSRYFGFNDIEFVWEQDRTLNALDQAKVDDIYVRAGVLSIDEVRESLGKHPLGFSNAVITTTGFVSLSASGSQIKDGDTQG